MHRFPPLVFLLSCLLPAQVVRVANLAPVPFSGWKRTVVDIAPPHQAGAVGDVVYVVGRPVGLETRVVDLRLTLAAGEEQAGRVVARVLSSEAVATGLQGLLDRKSVV
mgnify:CR=1 FL=1